LARGFIGCTADGALRERARRCEKDSERNCECVNWPKSAAVRCHTPEITHCAPKRDATDKTDQTSNNSFSHLSIGENDPEALNDVHESTCDGCCSFATEVKVTRHNPSPSRNAKSL
jgi:hypothetical protein